MDFRSATYTVVQALENSGQTLTISQGQLAVIAEKALPPAEDAAVLSLMESHVRAALGICPTDQVDWSPNCTEACQWKPGAKLAVVTPGVYTINWQNILTLIETYLPQILAILLPLLGG